MFALFAFSGAYALEPDLDGDGFTASFDCDDLDAAVNPGADERCNEIDDDCDGLVDDDDDDAIDTHGWHFDSDGDGFGGFEERTIRACARPAAGWVRNIADCNDLDPAMTVWVKSWLDGDGDGYGNYIYWAYSCAESLPAGNVTNNTDCNDSDASLSPGAPEVCNEIDDNCDTMVDEADPLLVGTRFYEDTDNDGYGDDATVDTTGCDAPRDYVAVAGDCDVDDPLTHPDAVELCDGLDNDCNGSFDDSVADVDWYADADGDGYGDEYDIVSDCAQPVGYGFAPGDCDDTDARVSPGHAEVCGNAVDDDCDGAYDECTRGVAAVADFTVYATVESNFGAVVRTGDADGDGAADLLIGAPGWNRNYGFASVVYGPGEGETDSVSGGITISPARSYSNVGGSMAAGDLDGDGFDDIGVGAPGWATGSVYLFSGPVTADVAVTAADATIAAREPFPTYAGASSLIIPDHDGDGSPDVVVGVPNGWGSLRDAKVCVVAGPVSGTVSIAGGCTYAYEGASLSTTGSALASLGDENGDGIEDLLIGAGLDSAAYVIEGGGSKHHQNSITAVAVAKLAGTHDRGEGFGSALDGADLDGDGYADAVVSAPAARNARLDPTGVVYAFYGPFAGDLGPDDAGARWEIASPVSWGNFGWSVATGGDVEGDGAVDTLIAGPFTQYPYPGAVYVQRGEPAGVIDVRRMTSFVDDASAGVAGVAFVPDWNGDGGDEIAIGRPGAVDATGTATGAVSVIFSDSLFE